jgi:hypothetical protein
MFQKQEGYTSSGCDADFAILFVTKHPCCSTLPCQIFPTSQLLDDGESAFALPTTDWPQALVAGASMVALRAASEASITLFLIAMDEYFAET